MRTSTLVALVAVVVASPALSVPVQLALYARETPTPEATDDSGAISLKTIGTITSIAAPVIGGIISHFTDR